MHLLHIANLSHRTTPNDLIRLFSIQATPHYCRVFKKLTRGGDEYHYALVNVESELAARKLIEKYQHSLLSGQQINIKMFVARRVNNERRARGWRCKPWTEVECRHGERRVPYSEK